MTISQTVQFARKPVRFTNLASKLLSLYPNAELAAIKSFLFQLLQAEYLISELRPPLTIENEAVESLVPDFCEIVAEVIATTKEGINSGEFIVMLGRTLGIAGSDR